MNRRLWVTGLGLVTPLGRDVETTWQRLVRGDRAIRPVTLFDVSSQRVGIAAEVDDVRPPDGAPGASAAWSRTSAMAAAAAGEAMRMAGVNARDGRAGSARIGLVVGGTTAGMFETERLLARLHAEPDCREALADMLSHPLSSTGDRLNETLGPFARIRTVSSACSSGANAIAIGAAWLLLGEVDVVVAGGSDGLCRLTLSGFNALAALDPAPCRPFHSNRRGTSLGEGAGFLVLERAERAMARGAKPVAALAGWALGAEAHHITQPAGDGSVVAALIESAMTDAGVAPADLDYVNSHGTGTPVNDPVEAAALARALGKEIARVPVSSCKAQIGHGLGAAGAIEAAITALVVSRGVLVPTAGLDEPDPAVGVVHVPEVGRAVGRVRAALSNAFGFGGMDTVLVFTEADQAGPGPQGLPSPAPQPGAVVTGVAVYGPCGRLGASDCAAIPDRAFSRDTPVDPDAHLDLARSRRFDAAARLATVAVEHVLRESGAPREGAGVVLGSAFGSVDGSAAFMHRIFEKGARAASPAEFPNLVPSAPVGNVSIYAGLRGPVFATSDLAISAESAFIAARELVQVGKAPRVVAGAAEPRSRIGERVLATLFPTADAPVGSRVDLAVALLVESDEAARERGATRLARVAEVVEWRGDATAIAAKIPPPASRPCEVVSARPSEALGALVEASAWRDSPRVYCAQAVGESDALGGVALAVAAARIGRGTICEALVIGLAWGRGVAIRLVRS